MKTCIYCDHEPDESALVTLPGGRLRVECPGCGAHSVSSYRRDTALELWDDGPISPGDGGNYANHD